MSDRHRSKVFLSHASKDKEPVRKLARALQAAGLDVWFDENDINVGESITGKIQEGLVKSDYICIWLTHHSVNSGWVQSEWKAIFHDEAARGQTLILPVLAEDVEIPVFLRDKRYADFRTDYDSGLKMLLRALKTGVRVEDRAIAAYVKDLLEDLSNSRIQFPLHGTIDLVRTLKKLPRSGKKIRLETYSPSLPIRSVYDHVLSVAHSADCLFSSVKHGVHPQEKIELARCIAYHDISEALLGDIPAYTNLTDSKRNRACLFAERRLRKLPKGEAKRIANDFICMFLDDRERECLTTASRILSDDDSRVRRFFYVLDKIDPIIGVWRYLHQFRCKLDASASDFLKRMKDFFDNPYVKEVAKRYKDDPAISELLLILQDRQLASRYYDDEHIELSGLSGLAGIDRETFARLIQGTNLTFVYGRKRTR